MPDNAYYDGAQTDLALLKLAELKARQQPFFFGIGFYRPHLPFNAPKKYWDLYDPSQLPLSPNPFLPKDAPSMAANQNCELRGYRDFTTAPRPQEGTLPEADARRWRHGYFASVSYVDAQIGRLLDQLDHLGLADDTIVVLWGDHGWKLGDHNSWGKMTNYEVDTRVPLLRNPQGKGKAAIFTQYLRNGIWTAPDGIEYMGYCVRTTRHRYVEWFNWKTKQFAASELYDLARDPLENQCLQGQAPLRKQLAQLLRQNFKL